MPNLGLISVWPEIIFLCQVDKTAMDEMFVDETILHHFYYNGFEIFTRSSYQ